MVANGQALAKDAPAYAYIHESLEDYPAQAGTATALEELHCQQIKTQNLLLGTMSITTAVK